MEEEGGGTQEDSQIDIVRGLDEYADSAKHGEGCYIRDGDLRSHVYAQSPAVFVYLNCQSIDTATACSGKRATQLRFQDQRQGHP